LNRGLGVGSGGRGPKQYFGGGFILENALGLSGGQATLIAITVALTVLGLVGLAAAVFWERRWRVKYSLEFFFIAVLLGMVFYADWSSTGTYKAYQENLNAGQTVSGKVVEDGDKVFDRTVTVIAFQWGFAFITKDNEISRNAVVVKPNERVLFKVVSNDVIHGFNIPAASITAEIDPGDVRELWIRTPKEPGKYLIQCVNYCGVGHAQMKAWLVVEADAPQVSEAPVLELSAGEMTNGT
jgi:cytochrome c oxidase subunit II